MGWVSACQGLAAKRIQDHLHHALDIPRNLRVPEPQHTKPLAFQPLIAPLIPLATMPAAINFDHHPPPQIGEVRDERPNRSLPPEVQPKHLVQFPQLRPDQPFLRRHLMAQLSGTLPGDRVNAGHPSRPMPKAPHPNPPHKGEEGVPSRWLPAPTPTGEAAPLRLLGRGWGWGAADATMRQLAINLRWMR